MIQDGRFIEKKVEFYPEAKFEIGESVVYNKKGPETYPVSIGSRKNKKGFTFRVARIEKSWSSNYYLPKEVNLFIYFPVGDSGFYEYELESRGKNFEF